MKVLLKQVFSKFALVMLATLYFSSIASAKDLVIMTSLPSMEFPFFVHMQKQLDQEAQSIGGIKILSADGQTGSPNRQLTWNRPSSREWTESSSARLM